VQRRSYSQNFLKRFRKTKLYAVHQQVVGKAKEMEQIERTRRYLKRLKDIYNEVPYTLDTRDYYTDDVYSFFIHCYHIRDWIIRLNRLGLGPKDVDTFIDAHNELRICADLCNGTKHCELKYTLRTNSQPHIASTSFVSAGTNNEMKTTQGQFYILSDEKFYDALQLAESCMKLWDEFVNQLVDMAGKSK
jgi:hypothetical protein